MTHSEPALSEISNRLSNVELLLQQLVQARSFTPPLLNDTEKNIMAVLAEKPLKGAAIARRLGWGYNSNFKTTLSFLVRVGILRKCRRGYVVASRHGTGDSQDKSESHSIRV